MQTLRKTPRTARQLPRWGLLLAALLLLVLLLAAVLLLRQDTEQDFPTHVSTAETLFDYAPEDVVSLTITRPGEAPWTVRKTADGLMLDGEDGFLLTETTAAALLDAACNIPCEAVLTADPAEYRDHLADFGLAEPRYTAVIAYGNGTVARLHVGNPGAENDAWHYLLVDGDDRLFSFSRGMVEALFVSRESLREVTSPTLHKARIDRITLTGPEGIQAQWTLKGDITDPDAADKWWMTAPIEYPADADAISSLLANVANLRLGAYVCPATPENLTAHGFAPPRLTIDIHMAAGTIGNTNVEGALETTDWPEGAVTFVIGGAKNDMVDYVRHGDAIYISSHFTMGLFLDYDALATLSRYPVMVALGNLASLTIRQGSEVNEFVLTRTEQVAANNELVTDDEGNVVYDVTVTRDGVPLDYAVFQAAYDALTLVVVSGRLPEGGTVTEAPHTVYTFTDVDGTVHTVSLATFDALHDAVLVDGHQVFYLIKDGFCLKTE